MKAFQDKVGLWGVKTFKHTKKNINGIIAHLSRELTELHLAQLKHKKADVQNECADMLILLCSVAHLYDFDLLDAAKQKMQTNYERTWSPPDEDGVIEHVR